MKTAKDYSRAEKQIYRPENKTCPNCGAELKRSHTAWRKNIITLRGTLQVTSYAYRCPNSRCPNPGTVYRSAEAETLSIKYYQYGLDVIAKVGHLRFREYRTIRKAKRMLRDRFRLPISRSEVDLLGQAYLALLQAHRRSDDALLEKLRMNGGVVLAIDGVQPEKGNETLWILRDVTSGETLLARNLPSADTESIASLLSEVKAMRVPVRGVVSDAQRSIRLAVERGLPGVPHQLCHFHYLRNIARPVSEMDRALKVDVKRRVRGIRRVERRAALEGGEEARVVQRYCAAIRVALLDDGSYPLRPGGLLLCRRLTAIRESIRRSDELRRSWALESLLAVLGVLDEVAPRVRRLRRLQRLVVEANSILKQKESSKEVQEDVCGYVERLRDLHPWCREDGAAVQNILRFTDSYWGGLFHSYDHSEIPRTNNGLEAFIRSLKAGHRRTTGWASCQGFILRYGAYVALLDRSASQREVLGWFRLVEWDEFCGCYLGVRGFRVGVGLRRVVSRDLGGFLRSLELDWARAV